jgi:exopolysaccharide production protein ExoZ
MLIAFAVLAGPLSLPLPGLVNEAGNMSYALYLIHVPMGWAWQFIYRQLVYPAEAWGFFISLVLATFVSSWIFYRFIERPMTRWLNARLAPRKAATQG